VFSATGVTCAIADIQFDAAGMELINYDGSSTEGFSVLDTTLLNMVSFGFFTDTLSVVAKLNAAGSLTSGFNFAGTCGAFLMKDCITYAITGAYVDLGTCVFGAGTIDTCVMYDSGGSSVLMSGLANNANVSANAIFTAVNNRMIGGLKLSGVTKDDVRFQFALNDTIADTRVDGLLSFSGSSTQTTITTINTPVLSNATWTIGDESHFTGDVNGRITYIGERDISVPIDISSTVLAASGGDKQYSIYIAINGVIVADSGKQGTASSSKSTSIGAIWQHKFVTNDYVECWIENNSDTTNAILRQCVLRVN